MKRVEFLREKWSKAVAAQAVRLDHSMSSEVDAFDRLLEADPSPKKLYAEFVMRTYCAGDFLAEDIERMAETLSAFHKGKRRLDPSLRDIGRYKSERDVWEALREAGIGPEPENTGKGAKRSDRNRAHLESDVLTADGWTMATLRSAFAARWWGMGTRWCTTEKSGRTYKSYADRGDLRVFVSPQGVKHQLHVATASLCDAADSRVNMGAYLSTIPVAFVAPIKAEIEVYSESLVDFDPATTSHVSYRLNSLLGLPREFLGDGVLEAVDKLKRIGFRSLENVHSCDGWSVMKSTNDLSAWAIRYELGKPSPEHYSHVPSHMIVSPCGLKRVFYAIDPQSLRELAALVPEMPKDFREYILSRCVKDWQGWETPAGLEIDRLISLVPQEELSHAFWKSWAKKLSTHDERCLHHRHYRDKLTRFGVFPASEMTEEIALMFAKKGIRDRVPEERLTKSIARTIAKADITALEDPAIFDLLDEKSLADVYGGNNGENLVHMPASMKTARVIRTIVSEKRGAIKRVIRMIRNGEIDTEGMEHDDFVREVTMQALEDSAASLSATDIPLSREIYLDIVRRDSGMLSWVPLEYRDVEMCLASLDHSRHGLCHFPVWVVEEIRAANDGHHGITHNYRPSAKYQPTLQTFQKPEGPLPAEIKPFSTEAVSVLTSKKR